ncbi:MAG: DUF2889 domain-containing protein [Rhodoblastus sp.]
MPLPPPAARRHIHSRTVQCEGFLREDGLWEVEAALLDVKPFAHQDFERGPRTPADPVHKMSIRLTVDDRLSVVAATAAMEDVPYATCYDVPPRVEALVGLKLGGGWRAAVRERLDKRAFCTHINELIGPAITTLFQAMSSHEVRESLKNKPGFVAQKPFFVDGCWSWRADGPTMKKYFPQYAKDAVKG